MGILSSSWFEFKPETAFTKSMSRWVELRCLCVQNVQVYLHNFDKKPVISNAKWISRVCVNLSKLRSFRCGSPFTNQHMLANDTDYNWRNLVLNNPLLVELEVCNVSQPKIFFEFLAQNAHNLVILQVWTDCKCKALHLHFTDPVLKRLTMCKSVNLYHGNLMIGGPVIKVKIEESQSLCITMHNIRYNTLADLNRDKQMVENNRIVGYHAHCCGYNDPISNTLIEEPLNRVVIAKGTLRELEVGLSLSTATESLDEIQKILYRNANLLSLNVTNNTRLSDNDLLKLFANQNHRLSDIKISDWSTRFSSETVVSLMHACPQLMVAEINGYKVMRNDDSSTADNSVTSDNFEDNEEVEDEND